MSAPRLRSSSHQLFLGNFNNAAYWPGQMGYVALYSVAASTRR